MKTSPWMTKLLFNLNSIHHKRSLFYDRLGFPVVHWTDSETNPQPKINTEALKGMGDTGKALIEYNERAKILSMVGSMINAVGDQIDTETGIGRAHIGLRVPGTATGRCGGTDGLNLQNLPKDAGYLTAMVPQPGHKLITFDICYPAHTEVLTDRGFLRFNEVTSYDRVAAVDPITLALDWEKPKRVLWKKYNGPMHTFSNKKGSLSVTEGHTMLWAGQQSIERFKDLRTICPAQEGIPSLTRNSIFTAATENSATHHTKKELWMACLVQADATQVSDDNFNVTVARPAKVKKVAELLGLTGKKKVMQDHQTLEPYRFPNFVFKSHLLKGKSLFLEQLGTNHAAELFKALAFWDGRMKGTLLYWRSTDKTSVDQIERYFAISGYTVRQYPTTTLPSGKAYYAISISPTKSTRIKKYTQENYEGYVGCVTVNTGFIMVRNKGLTFVSGNCALEPTTLAAASGCKTLNKVYGPGAPEGMDVYSFVSAQLGGELGKAIAATGYDWKNPTAEATAKVKKEAKKWRNIGKCIHLAASYGAGPNRIRQTLGSSGIEISMNEVKQLHSNYWKLFGGVKEYEQHLVSMWERNSGWVLTPAGLPQAVAQERIRDIINAVTQAGGHQLFMVMSKILWDTLRENNIDYRPYVVDVHDCVLFTVPEGQALRAKELADGLVLARFNDVIKGSVTLRADANIVDNWWMDKMGG
jgi:DNA polymerase family A